MNAKELLEKLTSLRKNYMPRILSAENDVELRRQKEDLALELALVAESARGISETSFLEIEFRAASRLYRNLHWEINFNPTDDILSLRLPYRISYSISA